MCLALALSPWLAFQWQDPLLPLHSHLSRCLAGRGTMSFRVVQCYRWAIDNGEDIVRKWTKRDDQFKQGKHQNQRVSGRATNPGSGSKVEVGGRGPMKGEPETRWHGQRQCLRHKKSLIHVCCYSKHFLSQIIF